MNHGVKPLPQLLPRFLWRDAHETPADRYPVRPGTIPTLAAQRTVTLSVPGMYYAVCPITVKKALEDAIFEAGYASKLKDGPK
jgi:hypothetical protein